MLFQNKKLISMFIVGMFMCVISLAHAADKVIVIDDFIIEATSNDTEFEQILIDELSLQYQKDLGLPVRDLILEIKSEYDFYLDQNREEPSTTASLTKLFPYTGTELTASYKSTTSFSSTTNSSSLTIEISQPIARNAFGSATRLQDKIIGLEIDVSRHQIVEAYEDYLAVITARYYDWYQAYENLKVSQSSYDANLKLMDNIKERQQSSIALRIDVNKIQLQVYAKEEALVESKQEYADAYNFIKTAMRYEGEDELIPTLPNRYSNQVIDFEKTYQQFTQASRTYNVLKLLEDKSELSVDKNANDLLPSIDLLLGYTIDGDDHDIQNEDELFYAGVELEWPFGNQVERAESEVAKITLDKQKLAITNTRYQLFNNIRNLANAIEREKILRDIADNKIRLAQEVLEDEAEKYSFGRATINEYIQAVNALDNHRFNLITRDTHYRTLVVEWLRITDQLVHQKDILEK